jgi:hypothetical protein
MNKGKHTLGETPQSRKPGDLVPTSAADDVEVKAWHRDLVQLVLDPLSSQIDGVRLQLLERIQVIEDSTEIMAREIGRHAKRGV